jgi:hypothetical protein
MRERERTLWPFKPRTAVLLSISILLLSLVLLAYFRSTLSWPSQDSERIVLLGIFIISLLPIILMLADTVIDRGAVVEYKGVRVDFSQVQRVTTTGTTIPANIGVTGQPVNDSGTNQILDALRTAVSTDIVTIDLENGQAWWETRLLVLLSGALRHNHPKCLVFVATEGGTRNWYQGWGEASDLFSLLLNAHPQYPVIYHSALAAAQQWNLTGIQSPKTQPVTPAWMQPPNLASDLATRHSWLAFDYDTGIPNKFYAEQLLASELGEKIENKEPPRTISVVRLEELFKPVLHKDVIDESWPSERQVSKFFDSDLPYMAITNNGQYKSLIPRSSVINKMVGTLVQVKPV